MATELFIQHLATTTHNVVKAERKPRRNIQYRDVATAVSKTDNLEFLVDVVPKTVTYGEFKKNKAEKEAQKIKAKAAVMVIWMSKGQRRTVETARLEIGTQT